MSQEKIRLSLVCWFPLVSESCSNLVHTIIILLHSRTVPTLNKSRTGSYWVWYWNRCKNDREKEERNNRYYPCSKYVKLHRVLLVTLILSQKGQLNREPWCFFIFTFRSGNFRTTDLFESLHITSIISYGVIQESLWLSTCQHVLQDAMSFSQNFKNISLRKKYRKRLLNARSDNVKKLTFM